jgi:hypothetical protein
MERRASGAGGPGLSGISICKTPVPELSDVRNVTGRLASIIDNFGLRLLLSFCLAG